MTQRTDTLHSYAIKDNALTYIVILLSERDALVLKTCFLGPEIDTIGKGTVSAFRRCAATYISMSLEFWLHF